MKYSPSSKLLPQYHSSDASALGAPAHGAGKGASYDSSVNIQKIRALIYSRIGDLARKGDPWGDVSLYAAVGATPVPRGGEITRAGTAAPTRGERFDYASRTGEQVGLSPSMQFDERSAEGVRLAKVKPRSGLSSHTIGKVKARQSY